MKKIWTRVPKTKLKVISKNLLAYFTRKNNSSMDGSIIKLEKKKIHLITMMQLNIQFKL